MPEQAALGRLSVLVPMLASGDPIMTVRAIREIRRIMDIHEMAQIPQLAALPGMTPEQARKLTGHSWTWMRQRWFPSPSSLSRTTPPSPSVSESPSGS